MSTTTTPPRTRLAVRCRALLHTHHELVAFGTVGALTYLIDTAVFYTFKETVLTDRPVTAKILAVLAATLASYLVNRAWSFRTRRTRQHHHELALYLLVSGLSMVVYVTPLWVSRHLLHLHQPYTTRGVQEIADFTTGQFLGIITGTAFRWWAFRKWVFPARLKPHPHTAATTSSAMATNVRGDRLRPRTPQDLH